jgi:plasmid stability protein
MLALRSMTAGGKGAPVATLTIRGLNDETKARLRVSAARHGRSMEAEVRNILEEALPSPRASGGLGSRIRARFAAAGGVELDLPRRSEMPRAASLRA